MTAFPDPARSRAEPAASHGVRVLLRSVHMAWAVLPASAAFLRVLVVGPGADPSLAAGEAGSRLERAAGRALAVFCERLGATFIKVAQIASTRADLLPPGVVLELARLRDQVPPFPLARVREIVEVDLGASLESLFTTFGEDPVAAASVAQVHRATLRADGAMVAVKVRRPDILEKVRLDRGVLLGLAGALERLVPSLRLVDLRGAMDSFCAAVEEQVDLRREAANNARFRANFADDPDVLFPALVPALCSDRVLTMEFVEGVHERDLEGADVDVRGVVAAGMRGVCRMIFSHGFVHADLHPGNLRFVPPGRVVLLDLGLVGRVGDADRIDNARMLFAFATGDGATVARIFHDASPCARTPDYAAYEAEVRAFVGSLVQRGLGSVQLSLEIGRLFDILRRHRVQARSHMTMVNLALMTAEGLGKRLAPELSLTDAALPYLAEALGVPVPPRAADPEEPRVEDGARAARPLADGSALP